MKLRELKEIINERGGFPEFTPVLLALVQSQAIEEVSE
jgi:hypothetical protein